MATKREQIKRNEEAQGRFVEGQKIKWKIQDDKYDFGEIHKKYGTQYLIVFSPRDKNYKQIEAAEAEEEER